MTRNGKIARLPYDIREELNRRLRDGKSGPALLKWLNEDPECGEVLDEEFEGRDITKQNLSEWKQGGYKDWVRKEEARERVQVLVEKAEDLEKDTGGMAIADRLGTILAAQLAVAVEELDEIKDPKERWARQKDILRELYRLRREDHHARKLRMAEEQYERRTKEAEREKLLELKDDMQDKPLKAALHEGKTDRWKWADWEIRVKHGLPMPKWWTNPQTAEEWAELMRPYWWGEKNSPQSTVHGPRSKAKDSEEAPSVHPSPQSYDVTRRNSKDQAPESSECGERPSSSNYDATGNSECGIGKAEGGKSKRVRPRQTQPDEKSEPIKAGQSESKSVVKERLTGSEAQNQTEQLSSANGSGMDGSMGDMADAASPSGSESVKVSPRSPTEIEDERARADHAVAKDDTKAPPQTGNGA